MNRNLKSPKTNPVCVLLWQDAAYSYEKEIPKQFPAPQLTAGFIVVSTDKYTNIATNVNYNQKSNNFYPADGFVIPEKIIIEFKKIGKLNLNK
jgi:hypothetical protein